jgi:hypothetical protein
MESGDQHIRRLVRHVVPTDGAAGPSHHVLVVTADGPPDPCDVVGAAREPGRRGGRFGHRVHVRVLVVVPRR